MLIGSSVNMGLITLGPKIIPPPAGVDPTNMESLLQNAHLFGPEHFIFPFLAHALGTLVGAFIVAKFAANNKMKLALLVGLIFFMGGAMMAYLLPMPLWSELLDLVLAYFPMALLGATLAGARRKNVA